MNIRSFLAFAALGVASPAAADVPPALPAAVDAQGALHDYAAWLTTLDATEREALQGLGAMGPAWDRAMATRNAARATVMVHAEMARLRTLIATTNARLNALEKPDFAILKLPPDLQPALLVKASIDLNMRIGAVVESYDPILVALRHNDLQGVKRAATSSLHGAGLILDSQVLSTRARQATTPPDSALYDLTGFQLDFYRVGASLLKAPIIGAARHDPALATQLSLIADDCERLAASGAARQAHEIEHYRDLRSHAEAAGQPDRVALLDRLIAVAQADAAAFPLADRFAKLLRVHATSLKTQPMTVDLASAMMASLRPYRDGLSDISRNENAVLTSASQP